ncbi:MAG: LysM peptidoglycan-binding domain-containing protein [Phycisphaeraceae bacterium]
MARETKVGLIVGLGVILFVSVFVSDYLAVPRHQEALGEEDLPDFVAQTTNQTEFVLRREEPATRPAEPLTPRELAAASLEAIELREGPPPSRPIASDPAPPFRPTGPGVAGALNDATPIAALPHTPSDRPLGQGRIDDTHLAADHHLDARRRTGPGVDPLADLARVEIADTPLINRPPAKIKHEVVAGETLTAIAKKHYAGDGNMWRSIRDANPGKVGPNGEIVQGVVLVIPKRSTEADDTTQLSDRAAGNAPRNERQRVRIVTVQSGDTLGELAAKHLGSAGKYPLIMAVNSDVLDKPENLRAGMKLRIPAEPTARVIEDANRALATTDGPASRSTPAADAAASTKTYTVKEGDSLYRIAKRLLGDGERYDEIYKANTDTLSSANDIRVGMTLKLPSP